jgi:hypothetical protein
VIAGSAALVAAALCPPALEYALAHLGLRPLLGLDLLSSFRRHLRTTTNAPRTHPRTHHERTADAPRTIELYSRQCFQEFGLSDENVESLVWRDRRGPRALRRSAGQPG